MDLICFLDSSGQTKVAGEDNPFPVDATVVSTAESADTTVTHDVVTVGVTDTAILAANATRKGAFITNISDQTIWVAFGEAAVQGDFIPVVAGGSLPISVAGVLWKGSVRGICASGGKEITVIEV